MPSRGHEEIPEVLNVMGTSTNKAEILGKALSCKKILEWYIMNSSKTRWECLDARGKGGGT